VEATQTISPAASDGAVRRLRACVETLVRFGPRSHRDVASVRYTLHYLQEELTGLGYRVDTHRFGPDIADVNLVAERPGTAATPKVYELGAHHDTVPGSPGADDNASGVAGVLEAARAARARPSRSSVRFCLFGGEERGTLGSLAHLARIERGELVSHGAVVLESIGFRSESPGSQRTPVRIPVLLSPPRAGDFIAVVANWQSRGLARSFERAVRDCEPDLPIFSVKALGGFIRDAARSDHVPYWRAGRRAVMITDTANFRNPNYHRPTDLPETLDYGFLASVVRATTEAMLLLAQ
jgi:hypothetical protein